jgi:hypothetical protein
VEPARIVLAAADRKAAQQIAHRIGQLAASRRERLTGAHGSVIC